MIKPLIDIDNKIICGMTKVKDIRKYGLLRASGFMRDDHDEDR